ncbi:hypothetical protein [Thalassospira marina]|uniref:VapC45 PIN like domain-containing protein n=1 Tax=Thalassospira marina TaxID=2048283 RepID=A0ABM6Q604_9PROT|nr:hypothetical protein [Thalassospira marina]AUG51943.1 hypothetical protein CSC3H3_03820 [Thalassospira marina]
MIFYFDENMPPRLARAIRILAENEEYSVELVREKFGPGTADINWMTQAGQEGSGFTISCDRRIHTRPHEKLAFKQNNLVAFLLPKDFTKKKFWEKSAYLVRWWPEITSAAKTATPGELFCLPAKQSPSPLKASR